MVLHDRMFIVDTPQQVLCDDHQWPRDSINRVLQLLTILLTAGVRYLPDPYPGWHTPGLCFLQSAGHSGQALQALSIIMLKCSPCFCLLAGKCEPPEMAGKNV